MANARPIRVPGQSVTRMTTNDVNFSARTTGKPRPAGRGDNLQPMRRVRWQRLLTILWAAISISSIACQQAAPPGTATSTLPPPPVATSVTDTAAITPTAPDATLPSTARGDLTSTPATDITPADPDATEEVFLPVVNVDTTSVPAPAEPPAATPEPPAAATALLAPSPTPFATVDFAAARATLLAQGRELATIKHGFHVTLIEDKTLLDNWMHRLDEAGIPFFLKAVDNAEPLYNAQEMMKKSGVPHVLVYRSVDDLPNYDLSPQEAARQHWELHRNRFPPELDRDKVWLETINEPDRLRSEWLAEFALETARLAMAEGFRWAAFGWAAGEPELEHWQSPAMLEFLRLVGENPDRLAIALHEGSGTIEDAAFEYPFRTGRFLQLFDVADQHNIPRPTVLITEWGWSYNEVPAPDEAMADIEWASRLYGAFPEVQGAAIWNLGLGCCFGNVSDQVEELIDPLTELTLTRYFDRPILPEHASTDPELYRP